MSKKARNCNLLDDNLPRERLGAMLVCEHCRGRIPASAAVTFEGSDYVRHFCGADCLARWCEKAGNAMPITR